jgi:hypothetical protein
VNYAPGNIGPPEIKSLIFSLTPLKENYVLGRFSHFLRDLRVRPPKQPWPDTPGARGLLLFAQLMREMLSSITFESFRVYTLDGIARLEEALSLLDDIQRGRLPRPAVDPVFAELLWSLEKDIIAREAAENEIEALRSLLKGNQWEIREVVANCELLKRIVGKYYKQNLESKLLERLADDAHRMEFRKLCGFYCSHLINIGYSKSYVATIVEDCFFDNSIQRAGQRTLTRFFNHFRGEPKKYTTYAVVSHDFGRFLERLGYETTLLTKLPPPALFALRETDQEGSSLIFTMTEPARDRYSAMVYTHQFLTAVRAMTYLSQQGMDCRWQSAMFVMLSRSNRGLLVTKRALEFDRPASSFRVTAGRRLKSMTSYSTKLLGNFDPQSTERIFSSLNTAALARTGSSPENQLISFWSAIEVLLSEPPAGVARIQHYAALLVPCVCLRQVRRQAVALFDEMLVSYRRKFSVIVREETHSNATDGHTRLAYLLLAAENEPLRKELCDLCRANPLALHRLWKFRRDYLSPKNIIDSIDGHEKRVYWQLHRIYRARNLLVHAGKVPSYLESLILNAAEYYRNSIFTIIHRSNLDNVRSDIDQTVSEIRIQFEIFKRRFDVSKKNPGLTHDDIAHLVSMPGEQS